MSSRWGENTYLKGRQNQNSYTAHSGINSQTGTIPRFLRNNRFVPLFRYFTVTRCAMDIQVDSKGVPPVQTKETEDAPGELEAYDLDDATLHNLRVANRAIEGIEFGKYQWRMFFTCGFGFWVDQVCSCVEAWSLRRSR